MEGAILLNRMRILIAVCGLLALGWWLIGGTGTPEPTTAADAGSAIVAVNLPDTLSDNAQVGETIFNAKCSACHGDLAAGRAGLAPPLVHKIYEPSHHGDEAFQRAVAVGVRQHHWPFGNMAPVDGLTRGDVAMVVAYIRELQRANGIN